MTLRRPDSRIAAVLAAGSAILFFATRQHGLFDDGLRFLLRLERGDLHYPHLLYLPACWVLRAAVSLVVPISSETTLKLMSALCGGIAVGLGYLIAIRFFARRAPALAATALLAVLPGFWFHSTASEVHSFHAACAEGLLLVLLPCAGAAAPARAAIVPTVLAVVIAVLSHRSGLCLLAPAVVTAWIARRTAKRLDLALAVGFFLAFGIYLLDGFVFRAVKEGYDEAIFTSYYGPTVTQLATLESALRKGAIEFCLYSAPASVFLAAGVRTLFARRRGELLVLGAWCLGYLVLCVPLGERAIGSYYVPTYVAQCLLAVSALERIAATPLRALVAAALGVIPLFVLERSEDGGLLAFAACALVATLLVGPVSDRPRLLFVPVAAAAFYAIGFWVPAIRPEPLREGVDAALRLSGPNDGLILLAADEREAGLVYTLAEVERRGRVAAPYVLDSYAVLSPAKADAAEEAYRRAIAATYARGNVVRTLESRTHRDGGPRYAAFRRWLEEHFRSEPVPDGPPELRRLVPL